MTDRTTYRPNNRQTDNRGNREVSCSNYAYPWFAQVLLDLFPHTLASKVSQICPLQVSFFLSFFCLHCPSNTKCHVRASNAPACQRFKTSLVCLVLVEGCDGPAVPGWIQEEEGPQGEASQDTENHAQILSRILGPSLSAILGPRLWVSPLRLENKFFGNLSRRSLVHFFEGMFEMMYLFLNYLQIM